MPTVALWAECLRVLKPGGHLLAFAGAKNNHPTVKPIELMRYLCRLVTPPGGIVLDPFTGSGSTAVGAALEGFIFFGAELDEGYHKIATARLDKAIQDGYIDTNSNKGA